MVVMTRFKAEFVDLLLVPINAPPAVARDVSRAFKALASCKSSSLRASLALAQAPSRGRVQANVASRSGDLDGDRGKAGAWMNGTGEQAEQDGEARHEARGSSGAVGGGSVGSQEDSAGSSWDWRNRGGNINGLVAPPSNIPIISAPRHAMTNKQRQPVLALAVDGSRVFAGSQDGLISVYDLAGFHTVCQIAGHSQTIFALTVQSRALYSSSTRVVKIWDTRSFRLLSTLRYSDGDVFSLALALGRSVAGPAGTSIIRCIKASASARARGAGGGAAPCSVPRPSSLGTICERSDADSDLEDSVRRGGRGVAPGLGLGSLSSGREERLGPSSAALLGAAGALSAGVPLVGQEAGEDGRLGRLAGMRAMHSLPRMLLTPEGSTASLAAASNSGFSTDVGSLSGKFSLSGGNEGGVSTSALAATADVRKEGEREMRGAGLSVWESLTSEAETGVPGEEEESAGAAAASAAGVASAPPSSAPILIPARPRADSRAAAGQPPTASSLDHLRDRMHTHGSPSVGCCDGGVGGMTGRGVSASVGREASGLSHEVRMNGGGAVSVHHAHMHAHGSRECFHSQSISPEAYLDSYLTTGLNSRGYGGREEGGACGQTSGRAVATGEVQSFTDARSGGAAQPLPNSALPGVAQPPLAAASASTPSQTSDTGMSASAARPSPSSSLSSSSSSAAAGAGSAAAGSAGAGAGAGAALCRSSEASLSLTDTDKGGHCSRVYALVVCDQELLCSGGGDTFVKVRGGDTFVKVRGGDMFVKVRGGGPVCQGERGGRVCQGERRGDKIVKVRGGGDTFVKVRGGDVLVVVKGAFGSGTLVELTS